MKTFNLFVAIILCQYSFAQNWSFLSGVRPNYIYRFYDDTTSQKLLGVGGFDTVGTIAAQGIASWDGTTWSAIGIPTFSIAPSIFSVIRYNGDLTMTGHYPNWDNNRNYVTRWNGVTLDSIGSTYGSPSGTLFFQNDLIVYGWFDTINNIPVNDIAKWDGATWTDLGHGNFIFNVEDVVEYKGELYACGVSSADNHYYIFKYFNNAWQIVGQTYFGAAFHLCVYNNELYVGSSHQSASDLNAIVKLDTLTNTWVQPGGGLSSVTIASFSQVDGMCVHNGALYVVGIFDEAGGIPASYIVKWDGTQWCGFGVGNSAQLMTCTSYNDSFYLSTGMLFDNTNSQGFVEWIGGNYVDTCGFIPTGVNEQAQQNFFVNVFPNPVTTNATFQFQNSEGNKTIIIYDQLGKEIWRKETSENQIEFSSEGFAEGLYFYRVEENGEIDTNGKFIIQR